MGLGKMMARSAAPENQRAVLGAGSVFGDILIDGHPVNSPMRLYNGGMQIPGAFRAAMLISDIIGSVPWDVFRKRMTHEIEPMSPTPMLLEQPNPQEQRINTFSSWALDLVWHGNAIGIVASRDRNAVPTAVLPVPAQNVFARRVNMSEYSPIPSGPIEYQVGGEIFQAHDVIHIKGPCAPGAVRGFGVLEAQLDTLTLASEQISQASSIARHGVPTGVLKTDNPDATTADLLATKIGWLAAQRERSVAVLNASMSFEALSWNPDEMQMVEGRKFTLLELALIFGLPPSFLGAQESTSGTYSNIEQESLNLLKFSMNGHLGRFEQTLSAALPNRVWVKANLEEILRADTITRFQAHAIAIASKFKTADEVRNVENLAPLTPEQLAQIAAATPAPPPAAADKNPTGATGAQTGGNAGKPVPVKENA